jgi:hypothetical protein
MLPLLTIYDRVLAGVGLKCHLYKENDKEPAGSLGYIGEWGAYGIDFKGRRGKEGAHRQYEECDALVAQLGY